MKRGTYRIIYTFNQSINHSSQIKPIQWMNQSNQIKSNPLTHHSINQSFNQYINQSINQSTNQSINQSINPSNQIDQSMNQWINQRKPHPKPPYQASLGLIGIPTFKARRMMIGWWAKSSYMDDFIHAMDDFIHALDDSRMILEPPAVTRARAFSSKQPNSAAARSAAAEFLCLDADARARVTAVGSRIILLSS